MLDLDLDLAELLLLAPAEDASSAITITELTAAERFVEGLCRSVGALAGCIVPPGDGEMAEPVGLVGRSGAARDALAALLGTERRLSRRGYSWIRDEDVPDHCGLMVEMPGAREAKAGTGRGIAGGAGHVLLVFARDHLDDEGVIAQVLTLAPGLGMMAGAMHDMAADLAASERGHRALAAVLRQSECGIVVVGADQNVLFANPAARAILDAGDGMELRRNMLRPTRYQDAVRFHAALDTVIAPPRHGEGKGDARAEARAKEGRRERGAMLLLERPGPDRPLIAVIAPAGHDRPDDPGRAAAPVDGDDGQDARAAAIVRLMRPEISVARGLEPICHLHGLSPVETQLVACLTRGLTLGEAASQMRIKPDTARTYLKQVFAKTDTHRQTDLLQLVLRYQRAVSGDAVFDAV
ncbi:MAG: hypothetical protein PGN08_04755 [Sphingomonas taxi]